MANPTNLADGDVLTETWVDAVRNQVVLTYASTGARDADLVAPFAGQTVVVTSNNSSEGILVRNSGSQWRPPWNLPHGVVGYSSTTTASSTTSGTTELVIATSPSVPIVGNRLYRITASGTSLGTAASDLFNMQIRLTNASGTSYFDQKHVVTGTSFQTPFSLVGFASGVTTGAQTFVLTAQRQAGTGTLQTLSGSKFHWIIEDIGPSGAPA